VRFIGWLLFLGLSNEMRLKKIQTGGKELEVNSAIRFWEFSCSHLGGTKKKRQLQPERSREQHCCGAGSFDATIYSRLKPGYLNRQWGGKD